MDAIIEKVNYRDAVSALFIGIIFNFGLFVVGYGCMFSIDEILKIKTYAADYEIAMSCFYIIICFIEGHLLLSFDILFYDYLLYWIKGKRLYALYENKWTRWIFYLLYSSRLAGQKIILYHEKENTFLQEVDQYSKYHCIDQFIKDNKGDVKTERINTLIGLFKGIMISCVILLVISLFVGNKFYIPYFGIIFILAWIRKIFYAKKNVNLWISAARKNRVNNKNDKEIVNKQS